MSRYSFPIALVLTFATGTLPVALRAQDSPEDSLAGGDQSAPAAQDVGWIKRNATPEKFDSRYTLVDRRGVVRYYLEPASNIELEKFINRQVSVRGQASQLENKARVMQVDEIGPPTSAPPRGAQGDRMVPRRTGPAQFPVRQVAHQQVTPEELPARPVPVPRATRNAAPGPVEGQPAPDGGQYGGNPDDCYDFLDGCEEYDECCEPWGPCAEFCGPPCSVWVRPEYLYWWTQGMAIPPLVTTGPDANNPGYIGSPGTVILFGDQNVNGFGRSGGRITAGTWLNSCQTLGLQGDYFGLASATTDYTATSGGTPILSRPFFDTRPSLADQNVEQVAFPGSIAGTISVHIPTQFQGAGLGVLLNLCCSSSCYDCSCCPGLDGPGWWRLDFLIGYRYAELRDAVTINESLVSLNPELPGTFLVNDSFTTRNRFHGVELGVIAQQFRGRWLLEGVYKLALGSTSQFVNINGSTTTTQDGTTTTDVGGLLALSSNIGTYRRDEFAILPQLGLNLGYQLTPRLRAIVGYTFLYWSQVARAGEQIDTDVNSTLLPNSPTPPTGDLRHPQFVFRETDFWAQGINVGIDYRW